MITLSPVDVQTLTSAACSALQGAHAKGWSDIYTNGHTRSAWEPRMVAHLCAGMAGVAAAWRPTLQSSHPGMSLNLTTVFTHQTPQVEWPPSSKYPTRCELADLLVAVIDRRRSSRSSGSGVAALVQAKLSDSNSVSLGSPSEKDQFDLLSKRPVFNVRPIGSAPDNVDLYRFTPDLSLLYGLTPPDHVVPPPNSGHLWQTADNLSTASSSNLLASKCLATTLVDILQGLAGTSFTLSPATSSWSYFKTTRPRDDWSLLINYLLEHTFGRPLVQLASGSSKPTRGSDHALFMVGASPQGNSMFFSFDGDPLSSVAAAAANDRVPKGFHSLGMPNWEGPESDGPGTENSEGFGEGPVSVVVFEVGDLDQAAQEDHTSNHHR